MLNLNKDIKILDLCCGSGRHCVESTKRDYRSVNSIDISETFLMKTEEDAAKEGVEVSFLKGDMGNLQSENEFDVVINIFTSFGMCEDEKENLKVLQEVFSANLRSKPLMDKT